VRRKKKKKKKGKKVNKQSNKVRVFLEVRYGLEPGRDKKKGGGKPATAIRSAVLAPGRKDLAFRIGDETVGRKGRKSGKRSARPSGLPSGL